MNARSGIAAFSRARPIFRTKASDGILELGERLAGEFGEFLGQADRLVDDRIATGRPFPAELLRGFRGLLGFDRRRPLDGALVLDCVLLLLPTCATVGSVPAAFVVGTVVAVPGSRTMKGAEIVWLLLLSDSLMKLLGSTMTAIRA